MNEIWLHVLLERHWMEPSESQVDRLVEAAAGVANALQAGLGPCIAGTLMEEDLRKALGLENGESVRMK